MLAMLISALVPALLSAAEQAEETHRELPMPPVAYALVALAVAFVLLMVTVAFRSVGKRH